MLSLAEVLQGISAVIAELDHAMITSDFLLMDTDKDGRVSLDEFQAFCRQSPELVALIEKALSNTIRFAADSSTSSPLTEKIDVPEIEVQF